ncbi:hypothetical protein ACFWAR_23345 [Streptomyces sp. NPDC059917]|uniref:hypothetical protein n=1 Tax=Streptomyces sp. NPDC059917 TaxID=3347002 RepID=UPI00364EF7B8
MPGHERDFDTTPPTHHPARQDRSRRRMLDAASAVALLNSPDVDATSLQPYMHALQGAAGNGALATALAGHRNASARTSAARGASTGTGTPVQRAETGTTDDGPSDKITYRLQLQVKKERRMHEPEFWDGDNVGHAWVVLYTESGGSTSYKSYGFFPVKPLNGRREVLATVPSIVKRNWDLPQGASSVLETALTREQVLAFKEYVEQHDGDDYNLARHNCVSFARGAFKAATGNSAPGLGLPLLENPNLLQDAIKRSNEKQGRPRAGEPITGAYEGDTSPTRAERLQQQAERPSHADSDSDESDPRGRAAVPAVRPALERFPLD